MLFPHPDPTLMTARQVAAGVVAEGGDTGEVKVLIADPGEEDEHDLHALFLQS